MSRITLLLGLCYATGFAAVPNPIVIGPIPARATPGDPSHDYPFFSTNVNLSTYGFVEAEFFLEGTANRYNTPALATGTVIDGGHPYRTRMVVRRPTSEFTFNGTVILEWMNSAANYDLDGAWLASHDHFLRRGYAWVGISAQQAGIHAPATGLKVWSPARYASLDVTQGGAILDDALSYDIFSQAARAVRSPAGVDPMGGLRVQRILAFGVSTAAARLVTYHNSVHPLAGVIDAFVIAEGGAQLRTDLPVKVFRFLTESEVSGTSTKQVPVSEPDSDHFRRWEVAGSSHLDFHVTGAFAPLLVRDFGTAPTPPCDLPSHSRIPAYVVVNALYDQLVDWVTGYGVPPSAPAIQLQATGAVARDRLGNALGGIRLPAHAVPTAVNSGVNAGPLFCRLYGTYQPFDSVTLHSLYPDYITYLSRVIESTLDNLKAGLIVSEDAGEILSDAAAFGRSGLNNPAIAAGGVLDGRTFTAGPVTPGSVVSIFGFDLATITATGRISADGDFPTKLFGTKVSFGAFSDAPLRYVSPTQINAVVPPALAPGTYELTVSVYGMTSRVERVTVVAAGTGR